MFYNNILVFFAVKFAVIFIDYAVFFSLRVTDNQPKIKKMKSILVLDFGYILIFICKKLLENSRKICINLCKKYVGTRIYKHQKFGDKNDKIQFYFLLFYSL